MPPRGFGWVETQALSLDAVCAASEQRRTPLPHPKRYRPRASGFYLIQRLSHRSSWHRWAPRRRKKDLGIPAQRPRTQASGPYSWGCRRPASHALVPASLSFSYPPPMPRHPLFSPQRSKISLPSTLSKSSKFSDRMIFQLPEKLGMVAALVAGPLDLSTGALDAESFTQKRCLRRLAGLRKPGRSEDNPKAGLGSCADSFYTLRGPALAQERGGPAFRPAPLPTCGGLEPGPFITVPPPPPLRPLDLDPWAGPKFTEGAGDCWLPRQWVEEEADGGRALGLGSQPGREGAGSGAQRLGSHICSPRHRVASRLFPIPPQPDTVHSAPRRRTRRHHQLVNHSLRVGAGAAEVRSAEAGAGSRVTAPNSREAGGSWGSGTRHLSEATAPPAGTTRRRWEGVHPRPPPETPHPGFGLQ